MEVQTMTLLRFCKVYSDEFTALSGILHLLFLVTNTLVAESVASSLLITKPIIRHDFEPVPSITTLTGYHPKLHLIPSHLNLNV
jgi:hypothetical protein